MSQLSADNRQKRLESIKELGFLRQSANIAITDLISQLQDDYEPIRLNATYALAAIGESAVEPLIEQLRYSKDD